MTVIPGPRPPKGHDRSAGARSRAARRETPPTGPRLTAAPVVPVQEAPVAVRRTSRGWAVAGPAGEDPVADLVEGMTLADLVAEEFGTCLEPDRTARRSARGPADATDCVDPVDARVAALERTVAQLEHALAARVSTERAIGVLAERHGTPPRTAFEQLRREARSQGRPVHELAREVLAGLPAEGGPDAVVLEVAPPERLAEGRR